MECILNFCNNEVEEDIHPHLCPRHENETNEYWEGEKDG